MILRAAALLLACALSTPCWAQDGMQDALQPNAPAPDPQTIEDLDDVREIVAAVIARSYPELAEARIEVREVDGSDTVFFTSNFKLVPLKRKKRRYVVNVNRKVYALQPPRLAVEGILAHELAHTLYYSERSAVKLLGTLRIFFSKRAMTRFERRTDLVAVQRGYAEGIKAYREWIYPQLGSEKALAKKRARYLTPAELDLAAQTLRDDPEQFANWLAKPPTQLIPAASQD